MVVDFVGSPSFRCSLSHSSKSGYTRLSCPQVFPFSLLSYAIIPNTTVHTKEKPISPLLITANPRTFHIFRSFTHHFHLSHLTSGDPFVVSLLLGIIQCRAPSPLYLVLCCTRCTIVLTGALLLPLGCHYTLSCRAIITPCAISSLVALAYHISCRGTCYSHPPFFLACLFLYS